MFKPLFSIFIPGQPKAVQSFRFTRKGRKYQPKEVVEWKTYIKIMDGEEFRAIMEGEDFKEES